MKLTGMSVYTSYQATNTQVLKEILSLYAKPGDAILDMTYGEGKFWTGIDLTQYTLTTNDLDKPNPSGHNNDFRKIPAVPNSSFDLVVLDPPYVHGIGETKGRHGDLSHRYGIKSSDKPRRSGKRYRTTNCGYLMTPLRAKDINYLYQGGMAEAWRKLKQDGILLLKTQDEIESGKQVWRHFQLNTFAGFAGFTLIDLFIVTQTGKPMISQKRQKHARKNHSYFMVYQKTH